MWGEGGDVRIESEEQSLFRGEHFVSNGFHFRPPPTRPTQFNKFKEAFQKNANIFKVIS